MRLVEDQTVLITGATDGLGRALAQHVARQGATLLLHGRDRERLDTAAREIAEHSGNPRVSTCLADLADLDQVGDLATQVAADHPQLDVLVNNAGIGADVPGGDARLVSADGHELRFAVNYLAGHLLTRLLLPNLGRAAEAAGSSRVVLVASKGQRALDFDDIMLTRDYSGARAYTQSKLAQIMSALDLAEELEGTGVTVNALHPATFMPTKIVAQPTGEIADGVAATARLMFDPALIGVSGRYYEGQSEARAADQAYDPRARLQLRMLADALLGVSKRK